MTKPFGKPTNTIDSSYYWYAVYTRSRNEKKAFERLKNEGFEVYLPLISREKKWSDRKKKVVEPLFRSYMFAKVSNLEYYKVLQDPSVVKYVTSEGNPVRVPENQILAIKRFLGSEYPIEITQEEIKTGDIVMITSGPLMGYQGEMVNLANSSKMIIRMEMLGHSILATISPQIVEKF